jgi:competence ComEA-like helix-hairpin-helix protein
MGLGDRDYMRKGPDWLTRLERRRWWQRIRWMPAIATATALLGLGSAAVWFFRDARSLASVFRPAEGSLRVNINTADADQLETLPGIGPALAQLIIAGRPYATVDELVRISGIGPRTLESLRPMVTTEGETQKLPAGRAD